jgi:hypothetical protein
MFRRYQKSEYRQAFQQINGMENIFTSYAKNYSVNISQAIADRDFPLTRLEVICLLKNITGEWPKQNLVNQCRPDDDSFTEKLRREEIAEYRSIYG